MVVAAFGLDGLDDGGCGGGREGGDDFLGGGEAAGFFLCVFRGVGIEGVFEFGEGGRGPVERWDV